MSVVTKTNEINNVVIYYASSSPSTCCISILTDIFLELTPTPKKLFLKKGGKQDIGCKQVPLGHSYMCMNEFYV